jgi:hypothetical protein
MRADIKGEALALGGRLWVMKLARCGTVPPYVEVLYGKAESAYRADGRRENVTVAFLRTEVPCRS